jgi:tetratricopeptide (TPR) repeat protein
VVRAVCLALLASAGAIVTNLYTNVLKVWWATDPRLLTVAMAALVGLAVLAAVLTAPRAEPAGLSREDPVRVSVTVNLPLAPVAAAGQVVVGEVPREPVAFQPRGPLLAEVAGAVAGGGRAVLCALAGGRGVGKSQLAGAYARQRIADGCAVVAWVNAETDDQLLAGLAEVAGHLGVADPEGDSQRSAVRLREHLAGPEAVALLVFDNATNGDTVQRYAPVGARVEVVVTTTDHSFAALGRLVEVEVYERPESLAYLRERTGLDDEPGAGAVAEELGDSPLALTQAASVITARHLTYPAYLDLLAGQSVAELLTRREGEPYPRGTAEAILLSLDPAEHDDPTGHTSAMLGLLAVLSADGVPAALLHTYDKAGPDVGGVLERVTAASLATWAGAAGSGLIVMHRLVARIIRERAQTGDLLAVLGDAVRVVAAAIPDPDSAWATREDTRHLPDQITAIWTAGQPLWPTLPPTDPTLTHTLTARRASLVHLTRVADLTRAINHGTQTVTDHEQLLGADHPDTLISRNHLAFAYRKAGDLGRAIPLYEQTLTDSQRVLGADHPDTLNSRNHLATACESAGDLGRAIPLLEQNLTDRQRVLGADHPDTLGSRNNLAYAYESAGDLVRAIPLYEQTLTDYQRVLGDDHPNTLTSRTNLAGAYQAAGDLGRAIPLFEQTLTDSQRVLGADHPDTLISRNHLAGAYESAGDLGRAIPLYEQTLTDHQRVLGDDHPNTLTSRNNLAGAYQAAGDLGRAIPLLEQTLTDSRRVLGDDHPNTLTFRNHLASAYRVAGDLGRAIPLLEQILTDSRRVLGDDHPNTLSFRNHLAYAYQAAGDMARATPLLEQTLTDRQRVLGDDHPDTLISRNNLAGAYEVAGDLGRAIPLYEQTLTDCRRVLGDDHPLTKTVRANTEAARKNGRE